MSIEHDELAHPDIAVELADAHVAAIEAGRQLNAFVTETPDHARRMAAEAA